MDTIGKGFWASVLRFFVVTWTEDPLILCIAGGILALALLFGLIWFYRPLRQLKQELGKITDGLEKIDSLEAQQASLSAAGSFQHFPGLHEVWRETATRVVWLRTQHGQRAVFMGSPRDLWTPPRLLAGRLNLNLAEAVPNLLVGIGLLFTFVFLTLALAGATAALAGQGGGQAQLLDATRELLRSAGGKFVTSLAGLLASVLWTLAAKWQMSSLEGCCDRVLGQLDRLAPFTGGEKALTAQFTLFSDMQDKLAAQHATSLTTAEVATGHKALTEELVASAAELIAVTEEQSATFKRFSTDLAVSMGTAIDSALAPRFESMTQQLVGSLDKLTERIGTINQDSLDRMAQEHAKALADATKQEMEDFKLALVDLAGRLTSAGGVINQGAGDAAKSLGDAGQALKSQMDETGAAFRAQLATAAHALNDAAGGTAGQLDAAGKQLAQGVSDAGAEITAAALGAAEAFRGGINSASNQLQQAGESAAQALNESAVSASWQLDAAGKQLAQGVTAAGTEITAAAQGAAVALRDGIESAANRLQQAGQNAAASIDIAGTTLKLQSEHMATTMAAQVDQCAQALARASGGVEAAMGVVMRQLGEAAAQASQQWAGGVSSAVDLLTQGAGRAAGVLGDSTAQAAKVFDASAADLARHAQNFGTVMGEKLTEVATATETMNREVQSIAKAAQKLAEQGAEGATRFNEALARTGQMVSVMGEMTKDWDTLVADLRGAAHDVRATTAPFSELVKAMTSVSTELTARAPQALSAIGRVATLLTESAQQTRDAMESSRAAMVDTSNTLNKTVASLRTGVESYTGQVATLHQQLDSSLSKAIRDINGSISNMSDAVEALNDSFGRLPRAA